MTEETTVAKVTPTDVLKGLSPLVLTAKLRPLAGQDRFQPAGFPEIGHVIYKAPRGNGTSENVCIVDSAASMANHLESVCMRGAHDYTLVDDLTGMPFLRCVTGDNLKEREVVVTSLTEGHRIASTYFLAGRRVRGGAPEERRFEDVLADEMALITLKEAKGKKKRYMPASSWWKAFTTIFRYDPNALVHGVLFPQWQIKIARALTAHLEACGAARVDRSGVKFDRLGKTTSGQPIFAVDDATAREITATFILDVSLIKSFGRKDGETQFGLDDSQQEFLVALALWKVRRLLESPFRFRSGCHLETASLRAGDRAVEIDVNIQESISSVNFSSQNGASPITDIYWPVGELYREAQGDEKAEAADVAEIEDENE